MQHGLAEAVDLERRFDAAVVSRVLPDRVQSDVVITLPDSYGGAGIGTIEQQGGSEQVAITGPEDLIDLLGAGAGPRHDG